MTEKAYCSATFDMLDRDSQEVTPFMAYPITKVQLNELRGGDVMAVRTFAVNEEGKWVEIPRSET